MPRILSVMLCVLMLVPSCNLLTRDVPPVTAPTFQEAIEQNVRASNPQRQPLGPITIHATQAVYTDLLVLYSYETETQRDGWRERTACYTEVRQNRGRWWVLEGVGCNGKTWSSDNPRQPFEPLDLAPGLDSFHVGGLVTDPAVRQAVLTFQGAPQQRVPIQNGGYLAVVPLADFVSLLKIELFDAAGVVRYRKTYSESDCIATSDSSFTCTYYLGATAVPTQIP